MIKATFAFLPDLPTQNRVTALAWRCHREYAASIEVRKLPPHLSLKQPFDAPDLTDLVAYMGPLARSIQPFQIATDNLQVWPLRSGDAVDSGILTIKVRENVYLRQLHQRLNAELEQRFGERPADFDGDAYSPHITVHTASSF